MMAARFLAVAARFDSVRIEKVVAVALVAALAMAATPRVPRATMLAAERGFDERIARANPDDPFEVLGPTRGVYLENYGAVFTTEVILVVAPPITPFRPRVTPEEREKLRQRKVSRLAPMRLLMRNMLVNSAVALNAVPPEEQIVVGVTFFYHPWELVNGLPAQIVMQARRKALVDFEAGRIKLPELEAAIHEQVY